MAEKRDYYELLGIYKNASVDDIKSAFKNMPLQCQPDSWKLYCRREENLLREIKGSI